MAERLLSDGFDVTLIDTLEPGDPRSESGGETRMFRFSHGSDRLYTTLAYNSLEHWRALGGGVLVEAGAVWFVRREDGWEADSERMLRELQIPVKRLDLVELEGLFPSLRVDDLAYGLLELEAGVLRAGDGVRALVARALASGLDLRRGAARPDGRRVVLAGRHLEADHVVWACGAWLPKLFPHLVDLRVTRQDVALFDVPGGWATPPGPAGSISTPPSTATG